MNLYDYYIEPKELNDYKKGVLVAFWNEVNPKHHGEGIDFITTIPYYSSLYAEKVIKGRWKKGEPAILRNPELSIKYARLTIKGRWKEAEDIIATNTRTALEYAKHIIKGEWVKGEEAISKDADTAIKYAQIIKKPFPQGEELIARNSWAAYAYAVDVIGGRWIKGEKAIKHNKNYKDSYEDFLKFGKI